MKRREEQPGPIKFLKREEGGMALEAALSLPLLLFALLFFIFFIQLSAVQIALQDTVSQAVRLTGTHVHPAYLAARSQNAEEESHQNISDAAGFDLEAMLRDYGRYAVNQAAAFASRELLEPLVRETAAYSNLLDPERVELNEVGLPDLITGDKAQLSMIVSYELPYKLPFTSSKLRLSAAAAERVWIPDRIPARHDTDEDGGLTILSIEPQPLRPGRKARVRALVPPNSEVWLDVWYKSGASKARTIGRAESDAEGLVVWEWHVSGNTTPGTWQLEVRDAYGRTASSSFEVRKKDE